MTVDQLIEQVWKLSTWDLLRLTLFDDLILLTRIWPLLVGVFLFFFVISLFLEESNAH